MTGRTGEGWLFSLARDDNSNWGEVEEFYDSIEERGVDENGTIIVDSRVWGTLQSTATLPKAGDGFAFYHSTRAGYPENDPFKRKPRISLMGELRDIEIEGRDLLRIVVSVDVAVLDALRAQPIIRDGSARPIFQDCGIVRGAVATLYRARASAWGQFERLMRDRL